MWFNLHCTSSLTSIHIAISPPLSLCDAVTHPHFKRPVQPISIKIPSSRHILILRQQYSCGVLCKGLLSCTRASSQLSYDEVNLRNYRKESTEKILMPPASMYGQPLFRCDAEQHGAKSHAKTFSRDVRTTGRGKGVLGSCT